MSKPEGVLKMSGPTNVAKLALSMYRSIVLDAEGASGTIAKDRNYTPPTSDRPGRHLCFSCCIKGRSDFYSATIVQ